MVPKAPPLPVHRTPSMPVMHRTASGPAASPAQAQRPQAAVQQQLPSNADVLHEQRTRGVLLICDFDKTLTDNDAGILLVSHSWALLKSANASRAKRQLALCMNRMGCGSKQSLPYCP